MPRFRAKARAVDLLGKGQIADLPTAISELWKNGYDAYGDNLASYLYLPASTGGSYPIFIISDDGKGMSKDEIMNKWFVLGTDSKSRNELEETSEETLYKLPRIKMGEKGIGRLAVAYLGPQMLMLTKKRKNYLEAVFFDWRILENFNLFLEDINIPNLTVTPDSSIEEIFQDLKGEFLKNFADSTDIDNDPWRDQLELKARIIDECRELALPPLVINEQIYDLQKDPLHANATRFIIFNPDDQIIELQHFTKNYDTEAKDESNNNHTFSALNALFNLFTTEDPEHKTSFNVVNENGPYDLLKAKKFFVPEDFNLCDHLIDGEFDEFGNFSGLVRVYRKEISHTFRAVREEKKTNYGPFKIKLGYVAGTRAESLLNDELWRVFGEKLELYGGLYVYRDGFRVLPYGREDNDFLEFEARRGKHAGEYFFAKRRMFGYIDITREQNSKLVDKSSREGFVNNSAYRDFKSNLIFFFKDLANKYFGTKAEYDYKREQQMQIEKLAKAELEERDRDIQARRQFAQRLKEYPSQLNFLEDRFNSLINVLNEKIENAAFVYDEIKAILQEIDQCKIKIQQYRIAAPTRFKPTDLQNRNYVAYNKQYSAIVKIMQDSQKVLDNIQDKLETKELLDEFESKNALYVNTLRNEFSEYAKRLGNILSKFKNDLSKEEEYFVNEFESRYKDILPTEENSESISFSLKILESLFNDTTDQISNRILPYLNHLERLSFDVNEDNLVGYYKLKFDQMKKEWNQAYELAQLGIAVEIIDHQFNVLYSQLSNSIDSLQKNLAPDNESMRKYESLKSTFHHLEDNYRLLQPLYRTTGRVRKNLSGLELYNYTNVFFSDRLKENNISFQISKLALSWTEFSYESIFKPVLINIVNNAIYWLQPVKDRKIMIDLIDDKLVVMNSGVPIADEHLTDIFDLFYSERPKGRGIGLYLAKRSLNGIGFNLYATNEPKFNLLNGACFIIEHQP
ncbi:hypothetical protein HGH93_12395 [Chitinophaga polysaccharea]|uniref:ATP-binding protein n=1 Tax=Chitinophaga polysaccharea TaxID=1293035 RepID=UPI0014553915|nr:ATP-binding protein [Chitinophaga polysaccharea]NLR58907.1 hypothetical protein [Chitinophaga polysaccharea]